MLTYLTYRIFSGPSDALPAIVMMTATACLDVCGAVYLARYLFA